jgi:hypothetical protein
MEDLIKQGLEDKALFPIISTVPLKDAMAKAHAEAQTKG